MPPIKRLVLDVLKPHDPKMVPFTEELSAVTSVEGVTSKLIEIEEDVRTIRVTVEGDDLDVAAIEAQIAELSGSVHSVDEVSCGTGVGDDPYVTD